MNLFFGNVMKPVFWFSLCMITLAFVNQGHADEPLKVGEPAPAFRLSIATKDTIIHNGFSLQEAIGKKIVILAFYPANWSSGCTKEMCTIRDNFSNLTDLGSDVYGISGDYIWAHREWAKDLQLPFPLLSDHKHDVSRRYQSFNEESGYNKRTVFVVDRQGRIAYIDLEYNVRTDDSFIKLKSALSAIKS